MTIRCFEFGVHCSGFPIDEQFGLRSEKCCVQVAIQDVLTRHRIQIRGFQKIFIDFESRTDGGLRIVCDALGVYWIAWPFNCGEYFSAEPDQRIRLLGMTCVAAIQELFRVQQLPTELLDQALTEVRNANFLAEVILGKKLRSPDKRRWACLSYKVTLKECTVYIAVTERAGKVLLKDIVTTQRPIFGVTLTRSDAVIEWISDDVVQVTLKVSHKETIVKQFVVSG